jgi:hypothetical protein
VQYTLCRELLHHLRGACGMGLFIGYKHCTTFGVLKSTKPMNHSFHLIIPVIVQTFFVVILSFYRRMLVTPKTTSRATTASEPIPKPSFHKIRLYPKPYLKLCPVLSNSAKPFCKSPSKARPLHRLCEFYASYASYLSYLSYMSYMPTGLSVNTNPLRSKPSATAEGERAGEPAMSLPKWVINE